MKRHAVIGMGALALLASHGLAAAQEGGGSGPAPFYLNDQQKQKIWQMLSSARDERIPPNFEMRRGATMSGDMRPAPIPRSVTREVPQVQGYAYVKFPNQVMIIDRQDGKVVERVEGFR